MLPGVSRYRLGLASLVLGLTFSTVLSGIFEVSFIVAVWFDATAYPTWLVENGILVALDLAIAGVALVGIGLLEADRGLRLEPSGSRWDRIRKVLLLYVALLATYYGSGWFFGLVYVEGAATWTVVWPSVIAAGSLAGGLYLLWTALRLNARKALAVAAFWSGVVSLFISAATSILFLSTPPALVDWLNRHAIGALMLLFNAGEVLGVVSLALWSLAFGDLLVRSGARFQGTNAKSTRKPSRAS